MAETLADLIIRIGAKIDSSMGSEFNKATRSVKSFAMEATGAFAAASVPVGLFTASLIKAASDVETYKTQLVTVFKDVGVASQVLDFARSYDLVSPFELQGIMDATVKISVYGQSAEKWLPLVGNLAAGMGKRIEDTSLVIGKALSGSLEGFESLRNEYGISTVKLQKYGAVVNSMGGMTVNTTESLNKARAALEAIITTDFAGATERQAKTFKGAMSMLTGAIFNLSSEMGNELLPTINAIVKLLTSMVEVFRGMPASMKSVIAHTAALITVIGGLGTAISGAIMIFSPMLGMFASMSTATIKAKMDVSGLTFAQTNMAIKAPLVSSAFLGIAGAAVVAGLAINELILSYERAWKAQDKLLESESKLTAVMQKARAEGWAKKSPENLKEVTTYEELRQAIKGYGIEIERVKNLKDADESAKKRTIEKLEEEKTALIQVSEALKKFGDTQEDVTKIVEKATKAIEHQTAIGKLSVAEQKSKYEMLLNEATARGASEEDLWKIQEKIYDLNKKAGEEQDSAQEKWFDEKEKRLDHETKMGEQAQTEELARLKNMLDYDQLTAEQRISLEEKVHDMRVKLDKDADDKKKKSAEELKKKTEDRLAAEKSYREEMRGMAKDTLTDEIDGLNKKAEIGENVTSKLIAAYKKLYDMEMQAAQETAKEKAKEFQSEAKAQEWLAAKQAEIYRDLKEKIEGNAKTSKDAIKSIGDSLDALRDKQKTAKEYGESQTYLGFKMTSYFEERKRLAELMNPENAIAATGIPVSMTQVAGAPPGAPGAPGTAGTGTAGGTTPGTGTTTGEGTTGARAGAGANTTITINIDSKSYPASTKQGKATVDYIAALGLEAYSTGISGSYD